MKYYLGLNSEKSLNEWTLNTFSGVGMIRGENLCINRMQYFTIPDFCNYVSNYLEFVAEKFSTKPVWYRTADLVPHQVNLLDGCDKKINDSQYLIGNRGVRRNLMLMDAYLLELKAFVDAYKKNNNLGLLLPFVTNPSEIVEIKSILKGLKYNGKIGIMIEIPSVILMLDEINELGIDYYTIGMNDLTTMLLASNRNIKTYDMNNPAVKKVVQYTIDRIHEYKKEVTLAGYLNNEIIRYAQSVGIDAVNIHYNEIPLFFNVDNHLEYTREYDNIKKIYKRRKELNE